jgi:hypothetical protein
LEGCSILQKGEIWSYFIKNILLLTERLLSFVEAKLSSDLSKKITNTASQYSLAGTQRQLNTPLI